MTNDSLIDVSQLARIRSLLTLPYHGYCVGVPLEPKGAVSKQFREALDLFDALLSKIASGNDYVPKYSTANDGEQIIWVNADDAPHISPAQASEIRDNREEFERKAVEHNFITIRSGDGYFNDALHWCWLFWCHALKQPTKPVSRSLEDAKLAVWQYEMPHLIYKTSEEYARIYPNAAYRINGTAKAVLDAAGVPYGD